MHDLFAQMLKKYELRDEKWREPLRQVLIQTFIKMHETSIAETLAIGTQISELQNNLSRIKKRHALGEIDKEIYREYKNEFEKHLSKLTEKLETSQLTLSNLEEAIDNAVNAAENMRNSWVSGDLEEKRSIQRFVFPEGIVYNHEEHTYRTETLSTVFYAIPRIQSNLEQNKNGKNPIPLDFSRFVPKKGIEPLHFRTRV